MLAGVCRHYEFFLFLKKTFSASFIKHALSLYVADADIQVRPLAEHFPSVSFSDGLTLCTAISRSFPFAPANRSWLGARSS